MLETITTIVSMVQIVIKNCIVKVNVKTIKISESEFVPMAKIIKTSDRILNVSEIT